MADLYKEPENSKKVGFQAPDLAITRHYQEPENSKKTPVFFQEPENVKKAHIQAPEISIMVDRFFMDLGSTHLAQQLLFSMFSSILTTFLGYFWTLMDYF